MQNHNVDKQPAEPDFSLEAEKTLVPNRPTELGYEMGARLAAMTDAEELKLRLQFPNHAERCKTCAFTAGTVPNGCENTLMDAIKCVVESIPFMCHQHFDENGAPTELCAGFAILQNTTISRDPKTVALAAPWEFSCNY